MSCLAAKRASDWNSMIRESEGAVAAGADSAPQVSRCIFHFLKVLEYRQEVYRGVNLVHRTSRADDLN